MPSSQDIANDAAATFAAYPELVTKIDDGTTVPDGQLDRWIGASYANFVDGCLEQINEVFVGSRAIYIPHVKVQVTAGDAFMFCAMLAVGPLASPLVAVGQSVAAGDPVTAMEMFRQVLSISPGDQFATEWIQRLNRSAGEGGGGI